MFVHVHQFPGCVDIIRKFTRKKRYNRLLPVLIVGGVKVDDSLEVGDALGEYFSSISSGENYSDTFRRQIQDIPDMMPVSSSDNLERYNVSFTYAELMEHTKKYRNICIGPDIIHYAFCKHMGELQLHQIQNLLSYLWMKGCVPEEWLHSYIVPILKPGNVASKPESYRPIQLTSCFGKVIERMIARRLVWFVEKENVI